ncbi:MAG: malonyl-ACP O-methyltransferase BioC [Gammaproteobacteria bacterium]|nr:malonyl-ACP O-methyltransferase BioC [Gammaproteobacteria bacterium]MDH3767256.1 malonyl-ACP O-methyltransferase BioC [Gammaproteobacteria bacterium]
MHQYRLEKTRVIKGFERAAAGYELAAVLPREVRTRLLERLDYLSLEPKIIVDMGAGTGVAARKLSERYPQAGIVALDISHAMVDCIGDENPQIKSLCADALGTPLPDQSVDLIFSNLMLPWCDDLDAMLAEFRRLIAPQGAISFSTFGPDTLVELRRAWQRADDFEHVHAFLDMHDIGDALMRAGFVEPVMDVERLTMTYACVSDLLLDLRRMGSFNALPGRRHGLTGNRTFRSLEQAYEAFREDGTLPATFEVIYGQAWGPMPGSGVLLDDGIAHVPIDKIGKRQNIRGQQ